MFSKLNPQNNQDFDAFLAESEPSLSLRSYRTTGKEPIKGDAATGENTSNAHLQYMNRTVDTCEDFYEHACGNYPNLKDVDIKYPKFSMFTRVDRKITSYIINVSTVVSSYLFPRREAGIVITSVCLTVCPRA